MRMRCHSCCCCCRRSSCCYCRCNYSCCWPSWRCLRRLRWSSRCVWHVTTATNSLWPPSSTSSPAQWLAQTRPPRRTWTWLVNGAVCLECGLCNKEGKKEQEETSGNCSSVNLSLSISFGLRAAQVFKWENLHLSYFTYLTHHNRCRCHSHCRCRCRCRSHCRRHCPNHCAPNSWAALHWLHWSSSSSASAHLPAMRWSLSSVWGVWYRA